MFYIPIRKERKSNGKQESRKKTRRQRDAKANDGWANEKDENTRQGTEKTHLSMFFVVFIVFFEGSVYLFVHMGANLSLTLSAYFRTALTLSNHDERERK